MIHVAKIGSKEGDDSTWSPGWHTDTLEFYNDWRRALIVGMELASDCMLVIRVLSAAERPGKAGDAEWASEQVGEEILLLGWGAWDGPDFFFCGQGQGDQLEQMRLEWEVAITTDYWELVAGRDSLLTTSVKFASIRHWNHSWQPRTEVMAKENALSQLIELEVGKRRERETECVNK